MADDSFVPAFDAFNFQCEIALGKIGWVLDGFDERPGAQPARQLESLIRPIRNSCRETASALNINDVNKARGEAREAVEAAKVLTYRLESPGADHQNQEECASLLRKAIEQLEPHLRGIE